MDRLFEEFPPVSSESWEAAIRAGLKDPSGSKRLVWNTGEGIAVEPYYRAEDAIPEMASGRSEPGWRIVENEQEIAVTVDAAQYEEAGATTVQELAFALLDGIGHLDRGGAHDVTFGFAIGSSYFLQIAKLRAFRCLWTQVLDAFGIQAAKTAIHCRTSRWNKSIYDPHVNILRATTEAMSAAIGGADSIHVEPFDAAAGASHNASRRLARNTQLILQHEAHLGRVADPGAGSYYIEALTDALAREAWTLMQRMQTGDHDAEIAKSRAAKEAAIAERRRVFVGVSQYPDPQGHAAGNPQGVRGPSPFEAIRLRTERSARRPHLLLAEMGDLKISKARSNFALNLFGCAGFSIVTQRFESASQLSHQADAVVLCSSDTEYASLVPAVLEKLGATPLIVAGPPREAAGVADFVHAGVNAVELLATWQKRLGVPDAA